MTQRRRAVGGSVQVHALGGAAVFKPEVIGGRRFHVRPFLVLAAPAFARGGVEPVQTRLREVVASGTGVRIVVVVVVGR